MLDLEILYFWMTANPATLNDDENRPPFFRSHFVELAFEHPFLMHEILSLSALHMAYNRPENASIYRHAAAIHHAEALPIFQAQLANLTPENCNACFAFSCILCVYTWAAPSPDQTSNLSSEGASTQESEFRKQMQFVKLQQGGGSLYVKDLS